MSDQTEQKQSQMTTNYESTTVHGEAQIRADEVIERYEIHETKILMSSKFHGHNEGESKIEDTEAFNTQALDENMVYQQFHDEPLETVEFDLQKLEHEERPEDSFEQKIDQIEHFDDFEKKEQDKKVKTPKIQQKIVQKLPIQQPKQTLVKQQKIKTESSKSFASYQNSQPMEVKQEQKVEQKKQEQQKHEQSKKAQKKKKSKKKKQQQSEPLPIIAADSQQGKKQILQDKNIVQRGKKIEQQVKSESQSNNNQNGDDKKEGQGRQKIVMQEKNENQVSQIKEEVSQIVDAGSVAAGLIIFQAQRERIGSTLNYFIKFTSKHQKHTTSQKQLILNVEDQIQKKKQSKTPLCNMLREYFEEYVNLCKNMYEKSYKYMKNEKVISTNPMINMKEELKVGIDELTFLRKSTGNQYNRLGDFIANNPQKNVVKLFMDYWKAIDTAQAKHKEKKDEFFRKEKQFLKRIAKVIKVYTKGAQGVSQEQDLFIEMTKYINQEQNYRQTLIEYGQSLIPLKKAFIKAEQVLYEQLQVIFNGYKNQFRGFYSLHPKEFIQIEKLQKQIREKNTFQKLSDITDADYVRSVLLNHEKNTVQEVTDRQFEKVLALVHFEEIIGNPIELLKGTTSKSFELKNKTQQVVDTISGNLLIFNKESAQMKEKFIIKNINAKIVQDGVVQIDQIIKGLIFNNNRTIRITFRDNDRAQELICFLNQIHQNIKENELANSKK